MNNIQQEVNRYNELIDELSNAILELKISEDYNVRTLQQLKNDCNTVLDGRKRAINIKRQLNTVYDAYTIELENYVNR